MKEIIPQRPSKIHRPFSFEVHNPEPIQSAVVAPSYNAEISALPPMQPVNLSDPVLDKKARRRSRGISLSHTKLKPTGTESRSSTPASPRATPGPAVKKGDVNARALGKGTEESSLRKSRVLSVVQQPRAESGPQIAPASALPAHAGKTGVVVEQETSREENKSKRRSRGFSLSRMKSDDNLRKRKSFFGGSNKNNDNVPDVPALPTLPPPHRMDQNENALEEEAPRPGTALTTDEPVPFPTFSSATSDDLEPESRSRRKSMASAMSRKRSKSSASQGSSNKRKSWFFISNSAFGSDAPPMPALPASLVNSAKPAPTSLPSTVEDRKSRRLSLSAALTRVRSKSVSSETNKRNRQSFFFQSSNPDDDPDAAAVPPVPALVHDGTKTPESMARIGSTSPRDMVDSVMVIDSPERVATRGEVMKQPRPVSFQGRSSYRPKSAAGGFLKTTSSLSGPDQRSHHRKSIMNDGDNGMICLNDEQQREWDKLKHLMEVMERRQDNGVLGMLRDLEDEEDMEHHSKYKNDAALAALEFGVAR